MRDFETKIGQGFPKNPNTEMLFQKTEEYILEAMMKSEMVWEEVASSLDGIWVRKNKLPPKPQQQEDPGFIFKLGESSKPKREAQNHERSGKRYNKKKRFY